VKPEPEFADAVIVRPPAARRPRPWLASLAMVLGALALLVTAVQQAAGPFERPPPIEQAIADKAKSILERAREAFRTEAPSAAPKPAPPPGRNLDQSLRGVSAALGVLAIALAIAGFARRESARAAGGALVLATAALPWQTGLAVALALVFVAVVARLVGRSAG
jgi:hypothetical protein